MRKETITFVDYNGVERTEDSYFNLSKAELMEMELSMDGGMANFLNRIVQTKQTSKLADLFKQLIIKSYGVKSDDGKRFIKNDELREEFMQTEAYSELYIKLATDANAAIEFVKGILPNDLASQINDEEIKNINLNSIQIPENTK